MTVRDSLGLPEEGIPNLITIATPLPIPWALEGWSLAGAKQEITTTGLSQHMGAWERGPVWTPIVRPTGCSGSFQVPTFPEHHRLPGTVIWSSLLFPDYPSEGRQLLVKAVPLTVSPLPHHRMHAKGGKLPPASWRPLGVPSVGSPGMGINPSFPLLGSTWSLLTFPPLL